MGELLNKISIDKIVRYGYPGFLILLILIVFEDPTKTYIKEIGGFVTTIMSFTIGATFYVVYRYVLGEYVLFQLMHLIHLAYECITGRISSPHSFLGQAEGVKAKWFRRRVLYNLLRRNYFKSKQSKKYDFAHSEIHLVYITGVLLAAVTFIYRNDELIKNINSFWLWFTPSLIITVAIVIDIQQHSAEYRRFKKEEDEIIKWIKKYFPKDS